MSRYLICGATGFIGRNLAERFGRLFPGRTVGVFHQTPPPEIDGVQWRRADLRQADEVHDLLAEGDVIIQAAATTSGSRDILQKPYIHTTDNAVMNSVLLRAAYERKAARFIFFSCSIMYPPNLGRALSEDDFPGHIEAGSPYFSGGWTKVYLEKMCEFYAGLGRTVHTAIRHSNIYGPHDKYDLDRSHMFGASVAKVMAAGEGGQVKVWGPGTEARDLLYVEDLVDFVVLALRQNSPFELVNVGGGREYQVNEVVEALIRASGKRLIIEHDLSKPHIPINLLLDNTKAAERFGWRPKTSLEEGCRKTVAWYRENLL